MVVTYGVRAICSGRALHTALSRTKINPDSPGCSSIHDSGTQRSERHTCDVESYFSQLIPRVQHPVPNILDPEANNTCLPTAGAALTLKETECVRTVNWLPTVPPLGALEQSHSSHGLKVPRRRKIGLGRRGGSRVSSWPDVVSARMATSGFLRTSIKISPPQNNIFYNSFSIQLCSQHQTFSHPSNSR